ncbi:MAG TPA: hypothetical protein VF772_10825 [Terriglobales bacterium]
MAIAAAVCLLVTFAVAQEQSRRPSDSSQSPSATSKKAKRGPRAIAVVEFLPNGNMRLVPVALWIEGKYYDASLYGANPEPMALEPQTVYEAQSFGEPTGTFTVTMPKQVNGNWVADGTWQPELPMDAQIKAKAAKEAAERAKNPASQAVMTGDADSGRPVLKRAPGSGADTGSTGQTTSSGGSGSSGDSSSSSKTSSSGDSDRPVMKRPASDSSGKPTLGPTDDSSGADSSSGSNSGGSTDSDRPVMKRPASDSSTTATQVEDHDPDRPVMKRPATQGPTDISAANSGAGGVTQAAATSNDSDPNRPTLSRTTKAKPTVDSSSDLADSKAGAFPTSAGKSLRAYPAISDAGTYQSRPLIYTMSSGERQGFEQAALKLAMDEIRAFAAKHNGPAIPKTAIITDYDARAFDLEYSSSPTVVVSAKLPVAAKGQPPDFTYFATVVARVDINDQAQKIFSSVTDSKHLDAYPRMELIDAIDADANGRGDLLFRQYSDVGITYGLYRVSAYQIEKIFEGGSSL